MEGKSHGSLAQWLLDYYTLTLQSQAIEHEVSLLDMTLQKVNADDNR